MRSLIAVTLATAMTLQVAPAFAMSQAGTASITGTAKSSAGNTLPNVTARLRNVMTNESIGSTTTDAAGQFSFAGLQPGTYVVEVLNSTGMVIATSATVGVVAGGAVAGVAVTLTAAAVAGAGAGLGTAAIILIAAAGAGVAAVVIAKNNASPSQ